MRKGRKLSIVAASALIVGSLALAGTVKIPLQQYPATPGAAGGVPWFMIGYPGAWSKTSSTGGFSGSMTTFTDTNVSDTLEANLSDSSGVNKFFLQGIASEYNASATYTTAILGVNNSFLAGDASSPIYVMYMTFPNGSNPAVKIRYDARYNGQQFEISFDGLNIYSGTFDYSNTFNNPAFPVVRTAGSSTRTSYSGLVDLNTSDNPEVSVTTTATAGRLADFEDSNFSIDPVYRVRAYRWNAVNSAWELADTNNSSQSNFSNLDIGRAYWYKVEDPYMNASSANTRNDASAIFMGDNGNIESNSTILQNLITPGAWNLVSLGNGNFREPGTALVAGYVGTPGAKTLRITSKVGSTTSVATITTDTTGYNDQNLSMFINNTLWLGEQNGSFADIGVRVYPTKTNRNGLLFVGPRKFTLSGLGGAADLLDGNITTLSGLDVNSSLSVGSSLFGETNTSEYGEYALAFKINMGELLARTGKGKMQFNIPEINGTNTTTVDFSDLNATATIAGYNTAMATASNRLQQALGGDYNVTLIDPTFSGLYDTVLIASKPPIAFAGSGGSGGDLRSRRFFVRDVTYVRAFDQKYYPAANIYGYTCDGNGTSTTLLTLKVAPKTTAYNIASSCDAAQDLNATGFDGTIYVASHNQPLLDLKETNNTVNIFDENITGLTRAATSGTQLDPNPLLGKIGFVYTLKNLYSATSPYPVTGVRTAPDGNLSNSTATAANSYYTDNLTYNAVWAPDFPDATTGSGKNPLYLLRDAGINPSQFANAETNASGAVTWHTLDLASKPTKWAELYDLLDTQGKMGWWVKSLNTTWTNPLSATVMPNNVETVWTHYNNETNTTQNWIDVVPQLSITGLNNKLSGVSHNVKMNAGGVDTSLIWNSGTTSGIYRNEISPYYMSFSTMPENQNLGVTYNISDGLGDKWSGTATIYYLKPATPTAAISGSNITMSSIRSDIDANGTSAAFKYAKYIRIYQNFVGDKYGNGSPQVTATPTKLSSTSIASGQPSLANGYSLLQEFPATNGVTSTYNMTGAYGASSGTWWGSTIPLKIVGVNGPMNLSSNTYGTVSDILGINYAPVYGPGTYIYNGTTYVSGVQTLSSTGDGTTATVDNKPNVYDATGTKVTTQAPQQGVQLDTDGFGSAGTVTMSYIPEANATLYGQAVTLMYVGDPSAATTSFARIGFTAQYNGKSFYLYRTTGTGSQLYKGTFSTTAAYSNSASPFQLTPIYGTNQVITK